MSHSVGGPHLTADHRHTHSILSAYAVADCCYVPRPAGADAGRHDRSYRALENVVEVALHAAAEPNYSHTHSTRSRLVFSRW